MSQSGLEEALAAKSAGPIAGSFSDLLKSGRVRVMPSLTVVVDACKQSVWNALSFIVSFFGATQALGGDALSNRTFFLGPRNEYESRLIPLTSESQFMANALIARLSFSALTREAFEEAAEILISSGFERTIENSEKASRSARFASPLKSFVVYLEWLEASPKPARPGIGTVASSLARRLTRAGGFRPRDPSKN